MKHLNDKATAIFRKLTEGLKKVGDHQQWNNDSSFMAACVEIIGRTGLGPLVSHRPLLSAKWRYDARPGCGLRHRCRPARLSDFLPAGRLGHRPRSSNRRGWQVEGPHEDAGRYLSASATNGCKTSTSNNNLE